jgi:hypothetical protein
MSQSCVSLSLYVVSGHAYSQASQSPIALSFLQTNYDLIAGNPYAIVVNRKGVVVGQILSGMIQVRLDRFSSGEDFTLLVSPCILLDVSMGDPDWNPSYVYDLGVLNDDGTVTVLGMEAISNVTFSHDLLSNVMICFGNVTVSGMTSSVILISRAENYEEMNAYTSQEHAIVMTSGALFCFGAVIVIGCHLYTTFNIPVAVIGVQSMCLLAFRGIYFFLLGSGDITVGGLLDFALIEIPTFIYIGIFLQIILPSYRFFYQVDMSTSTMEIMIVAFLLLNWIVFAAVMIAISFSTPDVVETKSCNCQISDPIPQNQAAEIIRIVYKSVVVVIAMIVVAVTLFFRTQAAKAGGIMPIYYQIVCLSLGLFFDCVAFVTYYAVNTPSAYFLIVLWFTELLPICTMNLVVTWATRKIDLNFF